MNSSHIGYNPVYGEEAPALEHIRELVGYAILEFGAPWCGHCRAAQPEVEKVLSPHSKRSHIKVYDGKGKPLGRVFRVKLWPTLILLHNGEEVGRLVRPVHADEIRKFLEYDSP